MRLGGIFISWVVMVTSYKLFRLQPGLAAQPYAYTFHHVRTDSTLVWKFLSHGNWAARHSCTARHTHMHVLLDATLRMLHREDVTVQISGMLLAQKAYAAFTIICRA